MIEGRGSMITIKEKYKQIVPELQKQLGVTSCMELPRLEKVVVNMGFGIVDKDVVKSRAEGLGKITGQKPVITKARKSISNFKLREGMTIGAKVTLRSSRMHEFLDRFINAALPRIRDFRGVSPKSFDGRGNYSVGIKEMDIFPEIDPNEMSGVQGMDVTIVTTAGDDNRARELLRLLGMPFGRE